MKPIFFGTSTNVARFANRERAFELLVTASFMLLSVLFASLYLRRGYSKALLYFSLGNLLMGIYTSTMNNQNLSLLFDYGLKERSLIQTTTMLGATLFFFLFTKHFFKKLVNRRFCLVLEISQMLIISLMVAIFF